MKYYITIVTVIVLIAMAVTCGWLGIVAAIILGFLFFKFRVAQSIVDFMRTFEEDAYNCLNEEDLED